jgi:hypothetical protein
MKSDNAASPQAHTRTGLVSDGRQILCFALALWNGRAPILKDRLSGLTNSEAITARPGNG